MDAGDRRPAAARLVAGAVGGGTHTAWPHAFYVPIIVAALPYGAVGAVVTAVAASILCGPFTPLDTMTGASQSLVNWLTRSGFFVVIGALTGGIVAAAVRATAAAGTDRLSGIANRARLDDTLATELAQSSRNRRPCAVAMLDLDDFKAINDVHGHRAGDRVIVETARRLAATARTADVVGRWGGEEFVVIAPDTARDGATRLAERCRAAIAATPMLGSRLAVTVSVGVAVAEVGDDPRSLVHRADTAMYRAKRAGRNQVVVAGMESETTG